MDNVARALTEDLKIIVNAVNVNVHIITAGMSLGNEYAV